jgi:hypothetical protein
MISKRIENLNLIKQIISYDNEKDDLTFLDE